MKHMCNTPNTEHLPRVMLCNYDVGSFPVTCQLVDIEQPHVERVSNQ